MNKTQNQHSRSNGTTFRLHLLGPMQIEASGREVAIGNRKARGLVAYVALRRGTAVPRDTLCGLLWGDSGEEQARASLRQTLSAIRKALGESADDFLVANNQSVALAADGIWIDAAELELDPSAASIEQLAGVVDLYRGELLEGLNLNEPSFDQWLAAERERLRLSQARLLTRLVEALEADRRFEGAIAYATRLVALDPLQESVHRALMRLYCAQNRHDAALNQFKQCQQELDKQLGVQPEKATQELAKDIRAKRLRQDTAKPGQTEAPATGHPAVPDDKPALPEKPSLAVLPFANISGDPEQEFFSDGITEDIITELSRFPELFVIARNSSFAYKAKSVRVQEIAHDLGVAYIVEGSVRRAGDRIRVTAQLVEAATGNHLWAERYDRELTDIFELQDEISGAIASTAAGRLEVDLTKRATLKPANNLTAYENVLRGQNLVHRYTETAFAEARPFFEKAISLDPGFARAHGWLAYLEAQDWLYWQMSPENLEHAVQIGETGLAIDDHDSRCHLALGVAHLFRAEHDKAGYHFDRASTLNPNDDLTMVEMARYKQYVGEADAGAGLVRRAMRQNPYHPNWYWNILARCLHTAGDYRGAIEALLRIEALPFWGHAYLSACYSELGEEEAAARHVRLTLSQNPGFTLKQFEKIFPYRDRVVREEFLDTLRNAGLPK